MKNESQQINIKTVEPEMYGQKCPVCSGFGSLKYGTLKCHGCEGRGFILVPIKRERQNEKRK